MPPCGDDNRHAMARERNRVAPAASASRGTRVDRFAWIDRSPVRRPRAMRVDRLSNFVEIVKPRCTSIFSLLGGAVCSSAARGNRLGRLAYMEKRRGVSPGSASVIGIYLKRRVPASTGFRESFVGSKQTGRS